MSHPAEDILKRAIKTQEVDVISWIKSLLEVEHKSQLWLSGDILTLLGRVVEETPPVWAYKLIHKALAHNSAEVRNSALQCLEHWGTPTALDYLVRHKDRVDWLEEYRLQIIDDLTKEIEKGITNE